MFWKFGNRKPEIRRASAYRWPDRILIHPESRTKEGIWIAARPMTRLDPDADTAELGRTLISALLSSAQGVAFSDYTSLARERFAASGFASEAVFMKSAALVSAELTAGHLVLTPHRNGGSSGDQRGFHGLPGKALLVREHFQGEMIGPMIFEAWELCE